MSQILKIVLLFSVFLKPRIAVCDYYSAISDLEYMLDAEAYLVENFDTYLFKVEETIQQIENFLTSVEKTNIEHNDQLGDYHADPIIGYKIISRLVTHWKRYVYDDEFNTNIFNAYKNNLTVLETVDGPTNKDLSGAINGLERLQDTYALSTTQLADGIILDTQLSSSLSASDCYEIGQHLSEIKKHKLAIEWLLAAKSRLDLNFDNSKNQDTFSLVTKTQILESLTMAFYNNANTKLAKKLNNDLLLIDHKNEQGLKNQLLFENKLFQEENASQNDTQLSDEIADAKTKHESNVFELYKRVCRKELVQEPREQRDLRCRLTSNNIPFRYIAPFKMEELSHDPFVAQYYDAIFDKEMKKIIEIGKDSVERSQVGELNSSVISDIRTSKNTWLWYSDHIFLKDIKQRLEDITGLSIESAEPLQVANYGIGGHYGPHFDFVETPEKNFASTGNRILTALFYINDVEMGGATAFPFLRIAVPPIRGSLLVWYNMHNSLEKDFRTKHAGCPVLKGSKWICNEWFHEVGQEFRRPCSLTPDGSKSIAYKPL